MNYILMMSLLNDCLPLTGSIILCIDYISYLFNIPLFMLLRFVLFYLCYWSFIEVRTVFPYLIKPFIICSLISFMNFPLHHAFLFNILVSTIHILHRISLIESTTLMKFCIDYEIYNFSFG